MKKQLFISLIVILLASTTVFSQGMYRVSYNANNPVNIRYEALLIWHGPQQAIMRIKYFDPYLNRSMLVQQNVTYMNYGVWGQRLQGSDAVYLTSAPAGYLYSPDHFLFSPVNGFYECTTIIDDRNAIGTVTEFRPVSIFETAIVLQDFGYTTGPVERPPDTSATLHLVIVADTSSDLGPGVKRDVDYSLREFKVAAEAIGMKFSSMVLEGSAFTKANTINALGRIAPSPNDAVIFLYSGHGFRYSYDTDDYPRMNFAKSRADPYENNIPASEVARLLKNKNARLSIAIFDTCNQILDQKVLIKGKRIKLKDAAPGISRNAVTALLLNARGNLIVSAASRGERAGTSEDQGSIFTKSFIDAFLFETSVINAQTPDWRTILSKAKDNAYNDSHGGQTAIFSAQLR